MRIDVVTIFPDYLAPLGVSLLGKARARGLLDVYVHDLRGWTTDIHRSVDDTPYGGGPGMVMRPEPWGRALDDVVRGGTPPGEHGGTPPGEHGGTPPGEHGGTPPGEHGGTPPGDPPLLVVPTPGGAPFTQATAVRWAAEPWLVFACGRYEGIDGRVLDDARTRLRVAEVSIGDYVLAGGEVAALVIVEAVARLLPGVLGNAASVTDDSFAPGAMEQLLEGPVHTRPASWRGLDVPPVLLSGDHAAIARWRRDEALRRTARRRPDLLAGGEPDRWDRHDLAVLDEVRDAAREERIVPVGGTRDPEAPAEPAPAPDRAGPVSH